MEEKVIDFAKDLISIPSVSGDEKEVLDFLENRFRENPDAEVFREKSWTAEKFAKSGAKKAVILSGHVDTVSAGNLSQWSFDPWKPFTKDGKLFGRGASDMKTGLAALTIVGEDFAKDLRDFDIWIAAVAHEEIDGQGSADFAKWFSENTGYDEAICLIGDGNMNNIDIGQHGTRFVSLEFHGKSGHASRPENLAKSGLALAAKFVSDTEKIREEMKKFSDTILGDAILTPTFINSGEESAFNSLGATARINLDIRTVPKLDDDQIFAKFMDELVKKYSFVWKSAADHANSSVVNPECHLVKTLVEATEKRAKIAVSKGANDQAFFVENGIQTVVYGLGDEKEFHAIDESVKISNIEPFAKIIAKFLANI